MKLTGITALFIIFNIIKHVNAIEYLISLKSDTTIQGFMESSVSKGHSVKEYLGSKIGKTFSIGTFKGLTVDLSSRDLLETLRKNPIVADVVPNFLVKAFDDFVNEDESDNENHGYIGKEGEYMNSYDDEETFPMIVKKQRGAPRHLARVSRRMQLPYDFEDIDAYKHSFNYYYDKWKQGSSVRAYILDSGIYKDHYDFQNRVEFGHDFTGEGPGDGNGHGTHVAGIVGSKTFGVAKGVTLVDVKCLDSKGHGSLVTVLSAIEFAVNDCHKHPNKRCVANLSLGAIKNTIINKAIRAAVKDNVVVVVAAGNFNMNACWSSPASAHEAITVGAFDDRIDTIAKFSNWGPCVDIFASGVSVASLSNKPKVKYVAYSGTSMASPNVCGMVALLLDRGVKNKHIKEKLIEMATDGIFQKRTLLFKPNTPNRILFNGIDKEDDQYDGYSYPQIDLEILLDELYSYSGNSDLKPNINRDGPLPLDNEISLPLSNLQIRKRAIIE